jgi:hypothetical protein
MSPLPDPPSQDPVGSQGPVVAVDFGWSMSKAEVLNYQLMWFVWFCLLILCMVLFFWIREK